MATLTQIVPIEDSALLSAKLIKNAKLNIYKGAPHCCARHTKTRSNDDLLEFIKSYPSKKGSMYVQLKTQR